jgi:hypothetical protein
MGVSVHYAEQAESDDHRDARREVQWFVASDLGKQDASKESAK